MPDMRAKWREKKLGPRIRSASKRPRSGEQTDAFRDGQLRNVRASQFTGRSIRRGSVVNRTYAIEVDRQLEDWS